MVVTVFGMGFVGLTTAVGFAENGIKVYGIDINKERTEIIKKGKIPFFEPGLDKALIRNLDKTFFITEDIEEAIQESDCIYYCVGTPYGKGGQADLSYLYSALESTLEKIKDTKFRVLVTKSTIPPSTTRDKIIPFIESHGYQVGIQIGIANNPEFLREGHCWDDFINADRIVLGVGDQRSENILCQLYRNFDIPIFAVSLNTGEFIKYLSNTLLATLISYSNEMSIIADTIGDINVAKAFRILHMDKRWNGGSMSSYAYPGCGYGGYCLPKDTNAIYSLAKIKGFDAEILKNVICINEKMPDYIAKKIEKGIDKKCCIGILGLSFKPGSDDVRDTPAEKIINRLIKDGYQNILAYDPIAEQEFQTHYKNIEMSIIKQKTRNSTHRIVACSKCGLQQLFPLPSVEEDKEYYDCNLHDRQVTPDFNIDQIYDKFYPQNAYRMQYLKEDVKIDKQWHILDYACGYGFLMELLLKEGYNVDGLEISEKKIEIIRQRSGQSGGGVSTHDRLKTFNLMEKDVMVPDDMYEKYDLVTMFHLIEHITTPVDFLQKAASLIKPNGYLLMEMPNVANLIMDVSPQFSDFFYIRDHVAYYTPELLKRMVEKAGYTVIKQRGTQIYSILNHMNWIINGIPQYINPSYDVPVELKWLDDYYKTYLDKTIKSEYMYLLAKKI